jgi:hypothetical protein
VDSLSVILTLAGLAVAVASIAIPIWIARRRRRITYEILSSSELASFNEELLHRKLRGHFRYSVQFDEQPHTDPLFVISIRIANNDSDIKRDEFDIPLAITFQSGTKIVAAVMARISDADLKPTIETQANKVNISPTLMNRGDWFVVQIVVALSDNHPVPKVRGHFLGGKIQQKISMEEVPGQWAFITGSFLQMFITCTFLYDMITGPHIVRQIQVFFNPQTGTEYPLNIILGAPTYGLIFTLMFILLIGPIVLTAFKRLRAAISS